MICRKCGKVLDEGVRLCPFCAEPVDDKEEQPASEKVKLKELAAVPADKARLLQELQRLREYFLHNRGKYGVMEDLWLMQMKWQAPSLMHWMLGGCLATVVVYMMLYGAGLMPQVGWSLFFILWGIVTCGGYIHSGRDYEARRLKFRQDLQVVENDVRQYYNKADSCFLPLDYSDPRVIGELIDGIKAGTIQSFQDYRIS